MFNKKTIITSSFILLITIVLLNGGISNIFITNPTEKNIDSNIIDEINSKNQKLSKSWQISFIHIQNDNWSAMDLPWIQNRTGKFNDPHIIENVTIDGQNSGSCILIESSSESFIIRNCTLYNSGENEEDAGIKLFNVYNGRIYNNSVKNNNYGGIYLEDSHNCTLFNNTANYNNGYGVYLKWSSNNTIFQNFACFSERYDGIILYNSHNNNISKNTMNNNDDNGIVLYGSRDNNITENILDYNGENGIEISYCSNITIKGNLMKESGIYIEGYYKNGGYTHNIDNSNKVNDKIVYYYKNKIRLTQENFTKAGQILLVNCNHSSIMDLELSHTSIGILLSYCNNNTFTNVTASLNNIDGFYLMNSNDNNITKGIINENQENGIWLEESHNNRIIDNDINYNGADGIRLEECNHTLIHDNTINNNQDDGVIFYYYCYHNNITKNTINNNDHGIYLVDSDFNRIIGNRLIGNFKCIRESFGCDNIIEDNYCLDADEIASGTLKSGSKDDDDDDDQLINGYDLFIILSILSIVSAILLKKKLN